MRMIDLDNELEEINLMGGRFTATGNGDGVDVSGYQGKLKATLNFSAGGGTDSPTMDVKIQDSADDITYADVSGLTFAQVTDGAAAFESIAIDTRGVRKWIRAVRTIAGTNPTFDGATSAVGQTQIQ